LVLSLPQLMVESLLHSGVEEMDEGLYEEVEQKQVTDNDFDQSLFDDFEDEFGAEEEYECEVSASPEQKEAMALEALEVAKQFEEDNDYEGALALLESAMVDLVKKRPKLPVRIAKLKQKIRDEPLETRFPPEEEEEEEDDEEDDSGTYGKVYECMYLCGFSGSYDTVSKHEARCLMAKLPSKSKPAAAPAPEPELDIDESLFEDDSDSD
jgi:hypothetical protein